MLNELRSYLEDPDHDDDLFVRLDSFEFVGRDLNLTISAMDHQADNLGKHWNIRATGVRDYEIRQAGGDLCVFERDHILARQYTDPHRTLAFGAAPRSPAQVVGTLLSTHRETVGEWIPFERYLNADFDLKSLLAGGCGQIADGPAFLMDAYARVLESEDMAPKIGQPRPATAWDGQQWAETEAPLATLLIGGAFFVAADFDGDAIED